MDRCRLSVNTTGAFFHPLGDVTPIDCRYGEQLDTVDLPDKMLVLVTGKTPIPWGRVKHPRGVAITNVSNQGTQTVPTEEQLQAMAGKVLYVGFGDASKHSLRLPPMRPGQDPLGGSQFLWLESGAEVWLDVPAGVTVTARIQIFPGGSDE
jgi:hypothetical protein